MAKQPQFQVEDIERLFRALLPSGREDPFGSIEEKLLELGKALIEGDEAHLEFQEFLKNELAAIQRKTFGILLLQIFSTIKFFFGLLPQGRVILLIVAAVTIINSFLNDEKPSLLDVKNAIASTGIGKFIDDILAEIQSAADQLGASVSQTADITSQMFVAMAGRLEGTEATVEAALVSLARIQEVTVDTPGALFDVQRTAETTLLQLRQALPGLTEATSLASNGAELIGPILRGIDDEISKFPTLALKLVRL